MRLNGLRISLAVSGIKSDSGLSPVPLFLVCRVKIRKAAAKDKVMCRYHSAGSVSAGP